MLPSTTQGKRWARSTGVWPICPKRFDDDEAVQEVLAGIPLDRRAGVEAQLTGRLEAERIASEAAAVRAAIEEQQALVLLQDALRGHDADRVEQILGQLPADRADLRVAAGVTSSSVDLPNIARPVTEPTNSSMPTPVRYGSDPGTLATALGRTPLARLQPC